MQISLTTSVQKIFNYQQITKLNIYIYIYVSPLPPNAKRNITLVPSHSMQKKKKVLSEFHSEIYKADDDDVQAMNKMQESDTKYTKIVKQNISDSHFLK